jgi:hypothetical protein
MTIAGFPLRFLASIFFSLVLLFVAACGLLPLHATAQTPITEHSRAVLIAHYEANGWDAWECYWDYPAAFPEHHRDGVYAGLTTALHDE